MQLAPGNNPFQQAIVNFQQHYDLMKTYLKKKRFIFVYEQCLKFYNKNNAGLHNHEILKLIKMIFYILKKKMILRCNTGVNLAVNGIYYEIFLMMSNVYMSWQSVLMTQMTAEEPQFFSMLFRTREYKQGNGLKIPRTMNNNLIFKPKPDSVVTSKINLEYKMYSFFKQLLRMTINSILVMIKCLNINKIQQIVNTIKKGEKIMQKFPQHIFPVQKIQFYILKCQIYEWASRQLGLCLNFSFKYQFPLGLFQLIYKNLGDWKQGKIIHYVNLLTKSLLISARNQLLSINDIYVLSQEIYLLMKAMNKKDTIIEQQVNKQIKGQKSPKRILNKKKSNHLQLLSSSKISFNLNKGNSNQLTTLNTVLMQIQKYLTRSAEINHVISNYLKPQYKKYKNFDPKDQLIDQIPVLMGPKKRLKKKTSQPNPDQQQRHRELFYNSKSKDFYPYTKVDEQQKAKDYRYTFVDSETFGSIHDGILLKGKKNKSIDKKRQGEKEKCREIIIRNIMNVKVRKKKLTLGNKKDNSGMEMKATRMGSLMSTTLSQSRSNSAFRSNPNDLGPRILHATLQYSNLPSLTPSLQHPINLLQQSSSSDQQSSVNSQKHRFQRYRQQKISSINSKYYNATTMNNFQNVFNDGYHQSQIKVTRYESPETIGGNHIMSSMTRMSTLSNYTAQIKRASEQIQYDQIKMLDDVIKDKILTLLDVEIENNLEKSDNIIEKNQFKVNISSQSSMINNYSRMKILTTRLLEDVKRLNVQRKLLTQELKKKMINNKLFQSISNTENCFNETLLLDLQNIYNLKDNSTNKAHSYQQLYRKLLHINDDTIKKTTSYHQNIKQKTQLPSTLKHYAKIHKQYNTISNKLSVIGETQEEEMMSQRTSRELHQQINLTEFIVQNATKEKKQQRQLKFNSHQGKLSSIIIDRRYHQSIGQQQQVKQIALREQFNNLSVDVSRSRFNYVNLANTNNTSTLLLKNNNNNQQEPQSS